eukprot:4432864-Prymnesium_polylepis.1
MHRLRGRTGSGATAPPSPARHSSARAACAPAALTTCVGARRSEPPSAHAMSTAATRAPSRLADVGSPSMYRTPSDVALRRMPRSSAHGSNQPSLAVPRLPSVTSSVLSHGKRMESSSGESSCIQSTPASRCVSWLRRSAAFPASDDARNR